jgi:hypothetical protein
VRLLTPLVEEDTVDDGSVAVGLNGLLEAKRNAITEAEYPLEGDGTVEDGPVAVGLNVLLEAIRRAFSEAADSSSRRGHCGRWDVFSWPQRPTRGH